MFRGNVVLVDIRSYLLSDVCEPTDGSVTWQPAEMHPESQSGLQLKEGKQDPGRRWGDWGGDRRVKEASEVR